MLLLYILRLFLALNQVLNVFGQNSQGVCIWGLRDLLEKTFIFYEEPNAQLLGQGIYILIFGHTY